MRHLLFSQLSQYKVALLVKSAAFKEQELWNNYVTPLNALGVPSSDQVAFTLKYNEVGKAPAKFIKEYLDKLLPALVSLGTEYLYVTDSAYFKTLTKQSKAEPHYGYVLPCQYKGYEQLKVVLGLNYQALIYNPDLQAKLKMSLATLASHIDGTHTVLGSNIIHSAQYPEDTESIAAELQLLHQYPKLSCDIEAFSLCFDKAGIGTVAFAWDEHNGIAFPCDYEAFDEPLAVPGEYGCFTPNEGVRALLRRFFETYQGELTFHNATYDVKVIIANLWMENLLDTKGLLTGLEIMTRSFQDTKIITYLATNSTAGNNLKLKSLAHEFAGNWAVEDIKDIRKIPLKELLQYNLVDALSTNYVKDKYYPIMVKDSQEELYYSLMLPSLKTIIQIELTGMPMDPVKVQETKAKLEAIQQEHVNVLTNSPTIQLFNLLVQTRAMEAANAKLKTKQHPLSKFADEKFNPNSGPQLQRLLYEEMCLPVIDLTDTKQPATGSDTIEKLIHHTENSAYKEILSALIGYGKATKILSTFIPAFEQAITKGNNVVWLHGSFNLGGTVSGRLSSNSPNLQNLPANSTYGKLIKQCFSAAPGWLFVGADFSSLEDRINALLTKDPAKIRVYTDGYDGHALRAFAYFGDQMPDIVDTVASINSIAEKSSPYYHLRQESKSPTFALTFQGTWITMVKNLGWSEDKAKRVEANYHKLYAESTRWVKARIAKAARDGYAEGAFGLRIRTPLLAQTILGSRNTPREAEAEARTLGNAISGQSYGLLNSRAMNAVMEKVWASKYRLDILPVAQIHDAGYYLVRDDIEVVMFANKVITEAMAWQELPEIQHDQVKLSAQLDIFWPNWSNPITIPNNADQATIRKICNETKERLK